MSLQIRMLYSIINVLPVKYITYEFVTFPSDAHARTILVKGAKDCPVG